MGTTSTSEATGPGTPSLRRPIGPTSTTDSFLAQPTCFASTKTLVVARGVFANAASRRGADAIRAAGGNIVMVDEYEIAVRVDGSA